MNYLSIVREKKAENDREILRIAAELQNEKDKLVNDWLSWVCVACNSNNRLPRYPLQHPDYDVNATTDTLDHTNNGNNNKKNKFIKGEVFFETYGKGALTRTVAVIKTRRNMPRCQKCSTYADHIIPLSSSHLFPYNKNRYQAFTEYPKKIPLRMRAIEHTGRDLINTSKSLFFGLQQSSHARLAYNDWRLQLYLNSVFPDIVRTKMSPEEFFVIGKYKY